MRPGNVHSADDWEGVLKPVVVHYKGRKVRMYFRSNAAFGAPEIYADLEAKGFLYSIRLPLKQVLQESIRRLLTRPVGRPLNHVRRYFASFCYQAGSGGLLPKPNGTSANWSLGLALSSLICCGYPNGW